MSKAFKGWTLEEVKKKISPEQAEKLDYVPKQRILDKATIVMNHNFPSMNVAHAGNRFDIKKIYDRSKAAAKKYLKPHAGSKIVHYELSLRYNSRMDTDNTAYACKCVIDCCRELQIVNGDMKQNYRKLTIQPDESLKHNTYIFTLTNLDYDDITRNTQSL